MSELLGGPPRKKLNVVVRFWQWLAGYGQGFEDFEDSEWDALYYEDYNRGSV